jgi:hypothetical protein
VSRFYLFFCIFKRSIANIGAKPKVWEKQTKKIAGPMASSAIMNFLGHAIDRDHKFCFFIMWVLLDKKPQLPKIKAFNSD